MVGVSNVYPSWRLDHQRLYSQSTTASCSPDSLIDANLGGTKRVANARSRQGQAPIRGGSPKGHQRRRLGIGLDSQAIAPSRAMVTRATTKSRATNAVNPLPSRSVCVSKTPALTLKGNPRKAGFLRSPGGTDYIVTPGRHKIVMTDFLASFDNAAGERACPALKGVSNYQERMLQEWREREKLIVPEIFMLSFVLESPMEQFRQMAIQSVFKYAVENKLHEKTVHLTCLNVSRLIHARIICSKECTLTHELFACIVISALRDAIKNDESYEKADKFRLDPHHVWRTSAGLLNACQDTSVKRLNQLEAENLKILKNPANPPLAPEFFDRYLLVGAWPEYQDQYRDLGGYLMGLSLFANGQNNPLRGTPNSKLAAAALVLAVKIINTDKNNKSYEFWPERLRTYTAYTVEELKPAIRGIATLLRNKPPCSNILEKYYSRWSTYDWN